MVLLRGGRGVCFFECTLDGTRTCGEAIHPADSTARADLMVLLTMNSPAEHDPSSSELCQQPEGGEPACGLRIGGAIHCKSSSGGSSGGQTADSPQNSPSFTRGHSHSRPVPGGAACAVGAPAAGSSEACQQAPRQSEQQAPALSPVSRAKAMLEVPMEESRSRVLRLVSCRSAS